MHTYSFPARIPTRSVRHVPGATCWAHGASWSVCYHSCPMCRRCSARTAPCTTRHRDDMCFSQAQSSIFRSADFNTRPVALIVAYRDLQPLGPGRLLYPARKIRSNIQSGVSMMHRTAGPRIVAAIRGVREPTPASPWPAVYSSAPTRATTGPMAASPHPLWPIAACIRNRAQSSDQPSTRPLGPSRYRPLGWGA